MVRRRRADGTGPGGEGGRRAKRKARSRSIDARRVGRTSHSPRTFHKCSVLSAPAVATVAPSGENSTHVTASSWPSSSMMGASREDVRWCAPGLNFCLDEGCATANAAELPAPVFCFCATRPSSPSSAAGAAAALRLPAIARSRVVRTRRGFGGSTLANGPSTSRFRDRATGDATIDERRRWPTLSPVFPLGLSFTRGGTRMPKGHQAHRKHASKGASAGTSKRDGKRGGLKVRPTSRALHRGQLRGTSRHRVSSDVIAFRVSRVAHRLAA